MALMGGPSPEREISLRSGKACSKSLRNLGHEVVEEDFSSGTFEKIRKSKPDLVFIIMHGSPGEDGTVQGMLDILNMPYTGSGVLASALSINKAALKKYLQGSGVTMPSWFEVPPGATIDIITNRLMAEAMYYPVVVKPTSAGSTIGISIVNKENELEGAILEARKVFPDVMIEDFIEGREITVSVVGNDEPIVLPTQEIIAESGFYDYFAKYTPGQSHHVFPPNIAPSIIYSAEEMAKRAYIDIGCRGFARADFIVGLDKKPYFLEMNTIPGMTELSLVPAAAKEYGWDFDELLKRIIGYALERE
jgi:D-alanine-D-alanine ligase